MNRYKYYSEEDKKEITDLLIGRKVKVVKKSEDNQTAIIELDNGTILEVIANEGCGGCMNRLVFNY